MPAKWIIQDNTLLFTDENNVVCIPSSQDIFYLVFGGDKPKNSILPESLNNPQSTFPELRFSCIGAKLKLRAFVKGQVIVGETYITKRGQNYTVNVPYTAGPDHLILNNLWIYLSENYQQVAELLLATGVKDLSEIPFICYIKIQNIIAEYPTVDFEDQVKGNLETIAESLTDGTPVGLNATLYPFQETGYKWLKFITDVDCGCILGDEMGLGKTIQIITLLLQQKHLGKGPSLVVAPVSLLENWKREITKFAPDLNVLVNHGRGRTGRYTDLLQFDVVVVSYNSTISDFSMLYMVKWNFIILDEAQNIKNPYAARTKSVKEIPCRAGIAVTGTPFENHITDIWSLLDFVMPGFLGTINEFQTSFSDDVEGAEKIEPILSSLMLRRKVDDVAKDLPEKVIIPYPLVMSEAEAQKYEDERQSILAQNDFRSATLATLVKLRMFCTHPFLMDGSNKCIDPLKVSTKYTRLCEILEEVIAYQEKTILFTSFTEMFSILREDIPNRFNIPVMSINGSTPVTDRQSIVDRFSEIEGAALLVLNPRAAGTGFNITSANHVIHYNLEWNPSLEDQSTARAYRRGQSKTVFVYRLYYVDTIEQIVNEKIEMKRDMSDVAIIGTTGEIDNRNDILTALMMSPMRKESCEYD